MRWHNVMTKFSGWVAFASIDGALLSLLAPSAETVPSLPSVLLATAATTAAMALPVFYLTVRPARAFPAPRGDFTRRRARQVRGRRRLDRHVHEIAVPAHVGAAAAPTEYQMSEHEKEALRGVYNGAAIRGPSFCPSLTTQTRHTVILPITP
jgi:hypothetical protein